MIYLIVIVIFAFYIMIRHLDLYGYRRGPNISPDGQYYLAMAAGKESPRPYGLRWLLPELLGENPLIWQFATWVALIGLGPVMVWYTEGTSQQKLLAAALLLGLPGVIRFNVLCPVLIDPIALVIMLLGAAASRHGIWPLAIFLSLIAGMIKESSPIFMVIASYNPFLLVGLIPVVIRYNYCKPPPQHVSGLSLGLGTHSGKWFSISYMLLPWGICLLSCFNPSWWLLLALLFSYSQLLVSTDAVRLYQWAFPVVIVSAVQIIPMNLAIPLILLHWFHPWQERV